MKWFERRPAQYTVCVFILALIIGTNFAYWGPLYDASIELELKMTAKATSFGKTFFQVISFLGDVPFYILVFVILFSLESRPVSFYFMTVIMVGAFEIGALKMAYHAPRPFISEPWLEVFSCSTENGNPSGHAFFSSMFPLTVFMHYYT